MVWTARPDILPLAAGLRPEPPGGWERLRYWTQRWAGDLLRLRTHPVWQAAPLSAATRAHIEGLGEARLIAWEVADQRGGPAFGLILRPEKHPAETIPADLAGTIPYRPGEANLVVLKEWVWICGGYNRDGLSIRSIPLLRQGRDPFGRDPLQPQGKPPPPEDDEALSDLAL